jgi:hypothetical protein
MVTKRLGNSGIFPGNKTSSCIPESIPNVPEMLFFQKYFLICWIVFGVEYKCPAHYRTYDIKANQFHVSAALRTTRSRFLLTEYGISDTNEWGSVFGRSRITALESRSTAPRASDHNLQLSTDSVASAVQCLPLWHRRNAPAKTASISSKYRRREEWNHNDFLHYTNKATKFYSSECTRIHLATCDGHFQARYTHAQYVHTATNALSVCVLATLMYFLTIAFTELCVSLIIIIIITVIIC